jgi:hypothetical protein
MIQERCSCGAKFMVDSFLPDEPRLVREWRKKHPCPDRDEVLNDTPTSGSAQVEMAMGFQPREMPFPNHEPDWEDE